MALLACGCHQKDCKNERVVRFGIVVFDIIFVICLTNSAIEDKNISIALDNGWLFSFYVCFNERFIIIK